MGDASSHGTNANGKTVALPLEFFQYQRLRCRTWRSSGYSASGLVQANILKEPRGRSNSPEGHQGALSARLNQEIQQAEHDRQHKRRK